MTVELLTLKDWLLAPIYIALLVLFTKYWADKYYTGSSIKRYILPAFSIKLIGCIVSILYHQYYYKGGDAFVYFDAALRLNDIFWQRPLEAVTIILSPADNFTLENWAHLRLNPSDIPFLYETNATMCKIGGVLSIVAFKSYFCISLLACYVSFLGCWKLFLTFRELYPPFEKEVALSMLFIPSVSFWGGGGLQKETILMASLGYFMYSFYWVIIRKHFAFKLILTLIISFIFIAIVRTFIAMVLIPAIFIGVLRYYTIVVKDTYKRLGILFCLSTISFSILYLISYNTTKYNYNSIMTYLFKYQEGNAYISSITHSPSYDLGLIEHSMSGIIKSVPLCITTALYRPSLLEAKNYLYLCVGLENLTLLLLTIVCIVRIATQKLSYTIQILTRPEIAFCLLFSLSVLFIVGFTTINFGGLVRCRISALPFFTFALLMISKDTRQYATIV